MIYARRKLGKIALLLVPVVLLIVLAPVIIGQQIGNHSKPLAVRPSPVSVIPPVLPATPGSYLGVYEKNESTWTQMGKFSVAAGKTPNIVLSFSGWGERFHADQAKLAAKHHAVLIVQLQPWDASLSSIEDGRQDHYLESYAAQVRKFAGAVILGFAHEMNGAWYPWGAGHQSPKAWVAAWRHVVTVFRQAGASNVTWLWTISSGSRRTNLIAKYWPGSSYVDWVGIDGYYFKPTSTFHSVFGSAIRKIESISRKPILISETSVGQVAGQAHEIPDLFAGVRRNHLLGLVWFDRCQHRGLYHQCWRLESHRNAIKAFRHATSVSQSN